MGAGLFEGGGGLGDPLAGLTLPPGDPASLYATAASYSAMGSGLEASAARQSQAMAGVGPAWIGNGAVSCQAAVNQLGASSRKVATSANNAAIVLRACAGRWEQAKARWAQAQNLAAQAMADEAAQRNQVSQQAAAGNPIAGIDQALGLAYQSPLRSQATALGQAAIDEFNQATHSAKGGLVGAAAPITPPVPKAPPVHQGGGLLNDLEGGLEMAGKATISFLGDPNNQKVFMDLAGIVGGLGLVVAGTGGEVGGGLLDGTIVLSPAGVAVNVASAGVIATGATTAGYGAWHLGSDITHMSAGDGGTPSDSGPGQWGTASGKGGSERAWQYQESKTGRPRTDGYYVDNPATGKPVEFDDYQNGNLIDYKGPGYEKPLTGDTSRPPGNGFLRSILDSATRQAAAAPPGTPIVWRVAERGAAAQMQKFLALDPATDRIVVVWDP